MLQLGVVTYNIAKDWDLPTILDRLNALKYEGVELRTGHAHGVEVTLSPAQRQEVKARFDDSPIELAGLGSAFEYQAADPAVVRANIDGTKAYVRLAHDVGAPGVKVRPNGVPRGDDPKAAFRRIGAALREVGRDAADFGIEIRVEVHGEITGLVPNVAEILDAADDPNVFVCWNSNPTDVADDGTIAANWKLVAPKVREVHLRDLTDEAYPWRELFASLAARDFRGYTLAEIAASPDPERVLQYFRSLWLADQPDPDRSPARKAQDDR